MKILEDETICESVKEIRIGKIIDLNDLEFIFKDRFNKVNFEKSDKKTFCYFKDFDLLLAYGFNEKMSWFEFCGFVDKLISEETALKERVKHRAYKKPKKYAGKNANEIFERDKHNLNVKYQKRYSFEYQGEEQDNQNNLSLLGSVLLKLAKKGGD